MRKGLSKAQVIYIVLLWVVLCVMLFALPSSYSLGENILVAVLSGVIITIAISKGQNPRRRNRDRD